MYSQEFDQWAEFTLGESGVQTHSSRLPLESIHQCTHLIFFFFIMQHSLRDLSSLTRIKPRPPVMEAQSLNHWTTSNSLISVLSDQEKQWCTFQQWVPWQITQHFQREKPPWTPWKSGEERWWGRGGRKRIRTNNLLHIHCAARANWKGAQPAPRHRM